MSNEVDIAAHLRVARVDDAGDAGGLGLVDFLRHQIHIVHDVRGWRRGSNSAAVAPTTSITAAATTTIATAAAARGCRRQTVRGSSGRRCRGKFRVEIAAQLQMLMEQRGAACQILGRVVFEERPDHGAFRKGWLLRKCAAGDCGRSRADSEHLQSLPAGQTRT